MFNVILKNLREIKNLSQRKLAGRLDLSAGVMGNYELGIREPDLETLIKIADFFEVTTDFLLGRQQTLLRNRQLLEG